MLAAADEAQRGEHDRHQHDHDQDGAEELHGLQSDRMWRRLRRRTMAPSRPLLYPDQVGLALFSAVAIVGGIFVIAKFAF